ncbi:MAG TPA: DNA (cytosine-5-)-methyltransferase, partial [bacterium]|nr:DNA (cytosine-5-)-methyltransferase [bacterium]
LFFDIARIAADKRPRYLLLENVKGLLSHDQGKTFQTILGVLSDLGYRVEWQVLNSKHFGVPQNRERVFIVGHLGKKGGRQVFPIGKDGGFPKTEQHDKTRRVQATKENRQSKLHLNRKVLEDGKNRPIHIRRLTPTECSRLQSFPDNWTKHGVVEATPAMYNKGYANAEKENASKVLRTLWKAVGSDKGKRRGFAKSITLFQKEILQPQLYAKRLQGDLEKGGTAPTGELQSEAVDSCDRMFEMWRKEKLGYTSQRQKQVKQRLEELRSIVSKLPHKVTQEGRRVESTKKEQGQNGQICFNWISDTQRYKCLGNAVTTNVISTIGKSLLT